MTLYVSIRNPDGSVVNRWRIVTDEAIGSWPATARVLDVRRNTWWALLNEDELSITVSPAGPAAPQEAPSTGTAS